MQKFVRGVVNHPRLVVALTALITLCLALFIPRIRIQLDVESQIPQGHPLVIVGKKIEKQFGGKFITVIGVYPRSGTIYTPEVLASVQHVTRALEVIPGVKPGSVLSLFSSEVMDVHGTDEELTVQPLAREVPHTPEEMADFKARVARNSKITDLLVGKDARATAILVDFSDFELAGGPEHFYERLEKILAPERSAEIDVVAAGAPTLLHWLMVYTRRVGALFIVALAMIGYLHYRAFRTLQGMLVPLVTAVLGVIWALGFMGLLGAPMDPWNIMTPILLLAIGAGHSVQILKRYYEELERLDAQPLSLPEKNREAVVEATTKVGAVMLAAGTIAALSFASLATFGLPSIRSFGICSAIGIVAALLIEMTFIPAVRVLIPLKEGDAAKQEKKVEFFEPWLEHLAQVVRAGRERKFLVAFLVLIAASLGGTLRLTAGNSMGAQFFEANTPVRGFRLADERLAGTRVLQVLLEGSAPGDVQSPKALRAMRQLATFTEQQPVPVGKVVSLADVFEQIDAGVRGVPAAEAQLPDSPEQAAQLLLLYSMSGSEHALSRLADDEMQTAVMTVYLKTDDYEQLKMLTRGMQDKATTLFAGTGITATVGGGMTSAIALNETMVHGKVQNLGQISALVVVITAILLRSVLAGFMVLLPLATSALVNLGVMGWLGIPLSMGTAAISAMAVGIGADYAVYFIFRVREERARCTDLRSAVAAALVTSGKAIAYVATAVAGGYLCLALSAFKMHVLLGCLVALTMVTASLATLLFLPAVLLWLKPKFLQVGAQSESSR